MERGRRWDSTEEKEELRRLKRQEEREGRDGVRERERKGEEDTHTESRTQGQHCPSSQLSPP